MRRLLALIMSAAMFFSPLQLGNAFAEEEFLLEETVIEEAQDLPMEEQSEETPAAEAVLPLEVHVHGGTVDAEGNATLFASADNAEGSVRFVWQRIGVAVAAGSSEADCEALYENIGEGETLTLSGLTAQTASEYLYRCVAMDGERVAASKAVALECSEGSAEATEEPIEATEEPIEATVEPTEEITEEETAAPMAQSIVLDAAEYPVLNAAVMPEGVEASYRWQMRTGEDWADIADAAGNTFDCSAVEAEAVRCVAAVGDMMLVSDAYTLPEQQEEIEAPAAIAVEEVTAMAKTAAVEETKRVVFNLGDQNEVTVAVGQAVSTIAAVYEDTEKGTTTFSGITWASSNTAIAKVDKTKGTLTGVKAGTATITATYGAGTAAKCSRSYEVNVVAKKDSLPGSVALHISDTTLGVGEMANVSVTFDADKSDSYALATTDKSIVMLMNDNRIVALQKGTATIRVSTFNGKIAEVKVTVKDAPKAIELNMGDFALAVGETAVLTASLNGAGGDVTFESDDDSVATVSEDGKVEAVNIGSTTIEATTYNGVTASVNVDVTEEITSLSVEAPRATIGVGEKIQMKATANDGANAVATLVWSVSNTKYASISSSGLLTAKANGTVTVTAKTANGKVTASCKVKVSYAPKSVSMSLPATTLGVGDSVTAKVALSSGTYGTWEIITKEKTGENVIAIDGAKITAKNPGEIYVRAKTHNNKYSAILTIKVVAAPTSIAFDKAALNIAEGDSFRAVARLNSGAVGAITYTSADPEVATVDANGNVRALKRDSSTQIVATTYNGLTATCDVTVKAPITKIEAVVPTTMLGVNEKVKLTAKADTEADMTLTYSSSSTSILKVDAAGTVTAKKVGSATVTITAYNGTKASVKFTVVKAPSTVSVSVPSKKIGLHDTMQMRVALPKGTAGSYTFKSTKEEVATVDANGLISAESMGSTTVGAIAYNGKYGTVEITVVPEPTSLNFPKESMVLPAGYSMDFAAQVNKGSAASVKYESSNEDAVTVSIDGKLTAVGAGDAVITATSYNGLKATAAVKVTDAVSTIKLSLPKGTMGVGEVAALNVKANVETDVKLTFTSSKTSVVRVDANGNLTARGKGTATITATAYNGVNGKMTVKVVSAPKTVTVKSTATIIGVGDTAKLSVSFNSGTAGSYTFKSADENYATVDENGVVTAKKETNGVLVGAFAHNGKYGTVKIKIVPAPTSLTFPKSSVKIPAGDTVSYAAVLNEGTAGTITYESTNPEAATVDRNGKVTALKEGGWTTIKATTYNGITASYSVAVAKAISGITLTAPVLTLGKNEKVQTIAAFDGAEDLTTTLTYETSNKKVATVNASGLVTAVGVGTAKIKVKTYNGQESTLSFTVKSAPSSVSISAANKKLAVGDTTTVTVKLSSGSTGAYELASSDEKILQVTQDGKVKAIAKGTAMIGVRTYNGKVATVSIEVGGGLISDQSDYSPSMSASEKIEYVIYVAQKNLGKPYSYSPKPPSSFDCSGFVRYCFADTKVPLKGSSTTMGADDTYQKIDKVSDLKRGDMVFFMTSGATKINHVGIYLGGDMFIHASSGAGKVVVTNMTSYLKTQGWACGRRIFK